MSAIEILMTLIMGFFRDLPYGIDIAVEQAIYFLQWVLDGMPMG